MKKKYIYVTQPSMPNLDDFTKHLKRIWQSKTLTNNGEFHQQLEGELCNYLGVEYISLFANGTIALITALKALNLTGEVITTPFSFVATSHSLLWNGNKPVFVDIDPVTLNIDYKKIEAAITKKTSAILPVHCYGSPCNTAKIREVADKYNLKVIYDAAHAFGVNDANGSILKNGDLSVLSFHATKVFNTFEGGAIVSPSYELKKKVDRLKNFGFVDEVTIDSVGLNGKMSELNSAFGLLQLARVDKEIKKRELVAQLYHKSLASIPGVKCLFQDPSFQHNYSYFPILIESEYPITRDELYIKLREQGVMVRRYFYPLISELSMYKNLSSSNKSNLPVAHDIAAKILCLPIYSNLKKSQQKFIIEIITKK